MAQQEVHNGVAAKGAVTDALVFTAVKPQLLVEAPKASDAIQFYKAAFGAEELGRTMHPKRKADQELPLILSAQMKLGGSIFLVSDLSDDSAAPCKAEGAGIVLCLETEDVNAAIVKAVSAGAVAVGEIEEGDGVCGGGRVGKVKDPYGIVWLISSPAQKSADVVA